MMRVSFEIFPSTRSCANFRRCAWLLNGIGYHSDCFPPGRTMWWLGLTTGTVLVAALFLRRVFARSSP